MPCISVTNKSPKSRTGINCGVTSSEEFTKAIHMMFSRSDKKRRHFLCNMSQGHDYSAFDESMLFFGLSCKRTHLQLLRHRTK